MTILDKEEKELLESVEKGEWQSVPDLEEEIKKTQEYARKTISKNKRIYIKISEKDLFGIQTKALEEGVEYKELISSIIHKYISGRLIDRE